MKNFIVFTNILLGMIIPFKTNYEINLIDVHNVPHEFIKKLKNFEANFTYPFSDTEQFRIEHGTNGDYFAFFKNLGTPYYFVATCKDDKKFSKIINNREIIVEHKKDEIAAVACAILRNVKNREGKRKNVWYVCDLKVNEKYQGEHLPLLITQQVALKRFLQCPRGYGICMNPPSGQPKAAKIFKEHGPISWLKTHTLNLYTLTDKQVNKYYKNIKSSLIKYGYMKKGEELSYNSTCGMKDYQIFNETGSRPWNLLHIVPSKKASKPQENAIHMICAVEGSKLDKDYKKHLGNPSSTAQIVSYGMDDFDFNFITSNQI